VIYAHAHLNAGEEKKLRSAPPGAVVALSWLWSRTQNCRLTYLLTYE